ncbi:hypothetical protein, conserved [Babesia bigemina]|uniref:Uncharacterized protein n=1 Tax=Babesia bigemina TaxID=5866 RepID=A0A061DDH7_BABBI|nr:hypothetical protein, conserved [Babesia bigemina]CDR97414.1 hypothetical protein, conserved [Babesia bigemina]|eukprot:XP_012769600.1 hypothetical protein, conserved [Babesia bigemina]
MASSEALTRILKWRGVFQAAKWPQLGNEVAEGPGSKYTNFSLQHIMDKYNFLPTLYTQREFLLSLGHKNPEIVQDAFLKNEQFNYYVRTDRPEPRGETPEALRFQEDAHHGSGHH